MELLCLLFIGSCFVIGVEGSCFSVSGYDSGEKKRIPAWCDRILYRDNRSSSVSECSLECPIVTSILQYVPPHLCLLTIGEFSVKLMLFLF